MSSPEMSPASRLAGLVHARQLRHHLDHGLDALFVALERGLSHRVPQRAGSDGVTLGVVGVQEALRGGPVDDLRELPSQIHRILHAEAEALSTRRVVHVRGVAGQEDASHAIGRGLPGHVGEPGDPRGVVDPEVGAVHGDERLAELAQGGLAAGPGLLLGRDHAERLPVLHLVEAVDAGGVVTDARRRLLGQLDLGDQVAPRRIPARELDAGRLADDAAPSVAPGEIPRAQRLAVGQPDIDPGVVLREARHLTPVVDAHRQLGDPGGHDPLDLVLEDRERVRMTRREVAHVHHGRAERRGLGHLTLREEPIGDPALIQHLDRARVDSAGPRVGEHVIGTPLDDRDVDLRQRQLGRQHHPRRTASGDHHPMLRHPALPFARKGHPAPGKAPRTLRGGVCPM